jgi:hypothetical protein
MANIRISCPSCGQTLRVPEAFQGRKVKCPGCDGTFTAPVEEPEAPVAGELIDEQEDERWEDEPNDEARPRRRRKAPHRGTLILVLGILSIVMPALGLILGPIGWIMGRHDIAEIRAGRMDRAGESSTNAGRICAMIGTFLGATCCVTYGGIFMVSVLLPIIAKGAR